MFIALGLTGGAAVSSGFRQAAADGARSAREISSAWSAAGRQLSAVGNTVGKAAAMVGGTALMRQVTLDVAEFERKLEEAGLTGDMMAGDLAKVRREIFGMSEAVLQLPEDELETFQRMVAAGIDPGQALAGLRDIARASTASFAEMQDMGSAGVDLMQKMQIAPEKMKRAFNIMHQAGKEGKFELKDMARHFPAVTSDAARFGIVGERGLAQLTAMLQIARKGTAMPEEAANNMRNFFASATAYRDEFAKLKINLFDFLDPTTGKFRAGKDIDAFFQEVIKKTGGSGTKLEMAGIRDRQAKDFILGMMANWEEYERIRDKALSSADAGVIDRDFDRVEKTTHARLKRLEIEKSKAMKSDNASWAAEKFATGSNWAVENPLQAAGAAAGGYALYRMGRNALSRRFGGAGGGLGGALGGGSGPIPVYVVNRHLSMLPGKDGFGLGGGQEQAVATTVKSLRQIGLDKLASLGGLGATLAGGVGSASAAAIGGTVVAGAGLGYGAGTLANKYLIDGTAFGDMIGEGLNRIAAALGSEESKRAIELHLAIDQQGRVESRTNDMNTNVSLNRGKF